MQLELAGKFIELNDGLVDIEVVCIHIPTVSNSWKKMQVEHAKPGQPGHVMPQNDSGLSLTFPNVCQTSNQYIVIQFPKCHYYHLSICQSTLSVYLI
jgi:hypothetical protein